MDGENERINAWSPWEMDIGCITYIDWHTDHDDGDGDGDDDDDDGDDDDDDDDDDEL